MQVLHYVPNQSGLFNDGTQLSPHVFISSLASLYISKIGQSFFKTFYVELTDPAISKYKMT